MLNGMLRRNRQLVAGLATGAAAGAAVANRNPWRTESEVPRAIATETDPLEDMPGEVDAVVIGGGISGITTALFLNEFGLKTAVFEKGFIGGEASSRNQGWIYSNTSHRDKLPMAELSKKHWFGFNERFGFDVTARQSGNLILLSSEEELQRKRDWLRQAKQQMPNLIDAKILSQRELMALIPNAGQHVVGGLLQPSDGMAEPTHAVPLIAKGARREGVKIFAPVAVRGVETSGGAIHSVVTEHGEVRTKYVVLAGGSWSRLFLGNLGINLPQQSIASSAVRVKGGTGYPGTGEGGGAFWTEHLDGSYSIGASTFTVPVSLDSFQVLPSFWPSIAQALRNLSENPLRLGIGSDFLQSLKVKRHWSNDEVTEFERVRMLTARPNTKASDGPLAGTMAAFPGLRDAKVVESWGGVLDATPDYLSTISAVPEVPGLVINAGHGGQGFAFGPGAGQLAAELIAGRAPSVDINPFRFSRFSDGTKLQVTEFF